MKKKPSKHVPVLKAFGGDRRANLEAIADEIQAVLNAGVADSVGPRLTFADARRLSGYAEQLRIIAGEWPAANKRRNKP